MSNTTTYLITGATRGIGLALVEQLRQRSHVRVIAGVRDATHSSATALRSKPNVTVVEIDSLRDDSAAEAVKAIEASGVTAIDVVFANAGIIGTPARVSESSVKQLRELINVNAFAPLLLFQAVRPLLQRSERPRFLVTSSAIGSLQLQSELSAMYEVGPDGTPQPHMAAYATSKTTANILTKRIALEEPWLVALPFHPGLVTTDMPKSAFGHDAVQSFLDNGAALTPEESAKRIIKLADNATLQRHSGRFFDVQKDVFLAF